MMVEQGSLAGHVLVILEAYQLTRDDRVLQFASIATDVAQEQIFSTLLSGAKLVLSGREVLDTEVFNQFCLKHAITVLDLPPSLTVI